MTCSPLVINLQINNRSGLRMSYSKVFSSEEIINVEAEGVFGDFYDLCFSLHAFQLQNITIRSLPSHPFYTYS